MCGTEATARPCPAGFRRLASKHLHPETVFAIAAVAYQMCGCPCLRGPSKRMSLNHDPAEPLSETSVSELPTRPVSAPRISAHAAAAQFKAAAQDNPNSLTALHLPPDILPLAVRHYLQNSVAVDAVHSPQRQLQSTPVSPRLPLAWSHDDTDLADIAVPDRTTLMIKYATATGLLTCGLVALWFTARGAPPAEVPLVTVLVPEQTAAQSVTAAKLENPTGQPGVTTAQILAVAERFVATGDVLAARAMLSARAAAGEPRAQFALAETYDPNMLSFWNAPNIEANVSYARLLYETARRNGLPEAQARLDALR